MGKLFRKSLKDKIHFYTLVLLMVSFNANATFIDFDDIVARPAEPFTGCFCGHVLANEYEDKGLIGLGGGTWLVGYQASDGTNHNYLHGFNGIALGFTRELPNFISFNIHAPLQAEASFFYVYDENDELLFIQHNNGWLGSEEISTPYIPGELVEIHSSVRIKSISIMSLFNLRTGPTIDNLTFEYRTVPEPSMLALILTSFMGLFLRRGRKKD